MKNMKKWMIISGSSLAAILALMLVFALVGHSPTKTLEIETTVTESTVYPVDISIEDPDATYFNDISDAAVDEIGTILTPDEKIENDDDNAEHTLEKADDPAQPVTPTLLPEESGNSSDVVIDGEQPEPYSCGVDGHHCSGPEIHSYILNLELAGCKYCGSHNCASFYATNEWGNTRYTPSKCPKYDIKKDPVYYCQECGKKCGDGSGGTCVQFVNPDYCSNCGEWVEGWTCHSCR